jgi:hypothetical protein
MKYEFLQHRLQGLTRKRCFQLKEVRASLPPFSWYIVDSPTESNHTDSPLKRFGEHKKRLTHTLDNAGPFEKKVICNIITDSKERCKGGKDANARRQRQGNGTPHCHPLDGFLPGFQLFCPSAQPHWVPPRAR